MPEIAIKAAWAEDWKVTVPSETEPHARTWMAWPSTPAVYGGPGAYYESVQETLGRLAAAIAENEPVAMAAAKAEHELAAKLCGPKVELVDIATDDMWMRDSGPVFVRGGDGAVAGVDFNFSGWGNKQAHARDAEIAAKVSLHVGAAHHVADIRGEGGGIEYDGDGTLLLTESCWVNDNRNPGLSRADIEGQLKAILGVETVIWLPGVRGLDITDGHIDGSFRFVKPGLLVASSVTGDTSEWGRAHAEALAILARSKDARGRGFEVVSIPAATDVRSTSDDFLTSYDNYYIGNGALYTPQFGDRKADAFAQETLGRLHPQRRIVQLEVDRIYENGGGIHCVTQQQPR
ncbi:agmatine deiminase family protein [Mesorhizobium sp. CU2]|uniref:agmatine deiminase family protein n=1 Tax=unclassified Mesorhizobium TaxID=325217 RepID=UPI0011296E99|nr:MULTISPECIES: agmatine deiminase family protein [unclassified Mesorhizobium]TPN88502.1 agmatine deiminase family protein [Mesorhizobium sp. CU3]TPO08184.1 agmatine deiminase family protein [Mesorhizobium sp. CU2]